MALGFLPVLLVRQNFNILCARGRTRRLMRAVPHLDDWLSYVYECYVNPNGPFPCPMWNV